MVSKKPDSKEVIDLSTEIIEFLLQRPTNNVPVALFALAAALARVAVPAKVDLAPLFAYVSALHEDLSATKVEGDKILN